MRVFAFVVLMLVMNEDNASVLFSVTVIFVRKMLFSMTAMTANILIS